MSYIEKIDTYVAGIPCQIGVISYVHQKPLGRTADSDWDCYGYTDIDWELLDRRGRRAQWLDNKADCEKIEKTINEHYSD